ncbi:hypothetical protein R1flu_003650 [Riccia fluitans]|uniref:Cation/H+ exchanger transmembrane domain-containing protein n=1 Tax=Riccia fluitans TaxID=41844 RepID=A0ABD1Y9Q2_9MARC
MTKTAGPPSGGLSFGPECFSRCVQPPHSNGGFAGGRLWREFQDFNPLVEFSLPYGVSGGICSAVFIVAFVKGVESSWCRHWRSASLGIVLVFISCSSLLIATSHNFGYGSEVFRESSVADSLSSFSFLPSFNSTVLWVNDTSERDDSSERYIDRRQLIGLTEGNPGAAGEAKVGNETQGEKDIEALVQKVGAKVTTEDDDYENVALIQKTGSDEEAEEVLPVQDGKEKEDVEQEKQDRSTESDLEAESGVVEKLLDMLEEDTVHDEKNDRFNKTITAQEGVLETVARVGGHSFDEEDGVTDRDPDESGKNVEEVKLDSSEVQKDVEKSGEDWVATSNVTLGNNSSGTDVTWLDRIMGESEQPRKVEPTAEVKDATLSVQPKKNVTRDKALEENSGYKQIDDIPRLIDREDNEYVISNPGKNRMKLQEDLTLISDIIIVIVAAAFGGTVCGLLGQPVILGYLAAGMVVGPGGLHLVHELVQVETLAQFGVVFLLFVLGVEFNPGKMQGVHGVALGGGCIQIGAAMLLGGLLGSSVPQGVFIGAFLSMSSTAVVVKCLMDAKMGSTEHGQIMLGTLILQDCALGLLLAIMPALAAKGSGVSTFVIALSREGMLLLTFCAGAWALAKFFIPRFLRFLVQLTKFNTELYLLGITGVCLLLALISQSLGLSLEVGAFVGGLALSGGKHTERTLHQVEPIRNIFAALFLASIGMVMHPIFLWQHKDILLASLAVVFFGKTCLFSGVVRAFGYGGKTSLSVGIALAQIGEFAFILLSRAQNLGLVSKKLYLLLMGTSALSLVLTPFAFKIVIRLMPSGGQPVYRKATSKPANSFSIPSVQLNSKSHGGQDTGEAIFWSPTSPNSGSVETKDSDDAQDQVMEFHDLEDGRADSYIPSPAGLVFRRPTHNVTNGKWSEWKKELEEHEVDNYRR